MISLIINLSVALVFVAAGFIGGCLVTLKHRKEVQDAIDDIKAKIEELHDKPSA